MPNEMNSHSITDGFHPVVDALKLNGIDIIFGVAGIPITDLARLAQTEGLRYIGFRHEQSDGNAAAIAGYLTRKPGICLTVSAPGFLNGMVALANAIWPRTQFVARATLMRINAPASRYSWPHANNFRRYRHDRSIFTY